MPTEEELNRRLTELEARERELEEKTKAVQASGLRHNLYRHVTLSVRTLDIIIAVCALLIVLLALLGAFHGQLS